MTLVLGLATFATFRSVDFGLVGGLRLAQPLGRVRERLLALLRFGLALTIGLCVLARDFRLTPAAFLIELLLARLRLRSLLIGNPLRLRLGAAV